jgi:hypothetical protein
MENDLSSALNKIQANNDLKNRTARFLSAEISKRNHVRTRPRLRLAAVCSVLVFFVLIGGFSYNLYFTPVSFVDVDVNPSIGLSLNRFNRVINTHAYNDYGAEILNEANIRFKMYGEAVQILIDVIISNGYLIDDGFVFITVQADSGTTENNLLESLNNIVALSLSSHHTNAQTDIFSITNEVRTNAHQHHVSPAKYLAIIELQSVDPTVTFESCRGHSVGEIRERTRGHGGGHHNQTEPNVPDNNNHHKRNNHH